MMNRAEQQTCQWMQQNGPTDGRHNTGNMRGKHDHQRDEPQQKFVAQASVFEKPEAPGTEGRFDPVRKTRQNAA
jgi:hypothetical protein